MKEEEDKQFINVYQKIKECTPILGTMTHHATIYSARPLGTLIPCKYCAFYQAYSRDKACTKPPEFGNCLNHNGNKWKDNIFWMEEGKVKPAQEQQTQKKP